MVVGVSLGMDLGDYRYYRNWGMEGGLGGLGRSQGPGKVRKGTGWMNKRWMEEEGDTEPEKE